MAIYSSTTIPDTILIRRSEIKKEQYIENTVKYDNRFVYGAALENSYLNYINSKKDFFAIVPDAATSSDNISVRTPDFPKNVSPYNVKSRVFVFDKFYKLYYDSKKESSSDSLFSINGTNVWNISSNSQQVIGLFIGYSKSDLVEPK